MNGKNSLLLLLSGASALLLCCPATTIGVCAGLCIGLGLCVMLFVPKLRLLLPAFPRQRQPKTLAGAVLFALLSCVCFVVRWSRFPRLEAFFSKIGLIPVCLGGAVLAVLSLHFLYWLLALLLSRDTPLGEAEAGADPLTRRELLLLLICSFGFITLCSESSFLYPYNLWVDVNCFFTVGKGMFNGLIPYRDLLEQKGPLLYFVYGLAWLLSHRSFLGVYLLELAAAWFFLRYSYLSASLLLKRRLPLLIPVTAMLSYVSNAFATGGGSEELVLPLLAFSLYRMLRFYRQAVPGKRDALVLGFVAGCVFWIKFTLVGLYVGWYIVFAAASIRRKDWSALLSRTGLIILGVLASAMPWLIYFGSVGAIGDWFTVYLYDNLFVYPLSGADAAASPLVSLPVNLLGGIFYFWRDNPLTLCLCAVCFVSWLRNRACTARAQLFGAMLGSFVLIYAGGRFYNYYSLAMDVFNGPGLALALTAVLPKEGAAQDLASRRLPALATAICLLLSLLLTPNNIFLLRRKSDLPQYQFREMIAEDSRESVSLLNYGFLDGGFYTVCDILPNCRSFCRLNMALPEMLEEQQDYVENGRSTYLVTACKEQQDFAHYDCIAESHIRFSLFSEETYRLYRLRPEP